MIILKYEEVKMPRHFFEKFSLDLITYLCAQFSQGFSKVLCNF